MRILRSANFPVFAVMTARATRLLGAGVELPTQFIDMERKAFLPGTPMREWTRDQLSEGLNVTLMGVVKIQAKQRVSLTFP